MNYDNTCGLIIQYTTVAVVKCMSFTTLEVCDSSMYHIVFWILTPNKLETTSTTSFLHLSSISPSFLHSIKYLLWQSYCSEGSHCVYWLRFTSFFILQIWVFSLYLHSRRFKLIPCQKLTPLLRIHCYCMIDFSSLWHVLDMWRVHNMKNTDAASIRHFLHVYDSYDRKSRSGLDSWSHATSLPTR